MTETALNEFVTGTLNASGNGTIRIGPGAHGVVWRPQVASIRMTGSTPTGLATCFIYVGDAAVDSNFVDGTYDTQNDSTDRLTGTELRLGQYVLAKWTGGAANATVTLTVTGRQEIP